MYSNKKIVQSLGEILKAKLIKYIIISPGSRNAPIIIHFSKHKYFKTYSIVDERCAAFFAIGISQHIQKPVVINCTSGSSVVNYYPAITEAYYQHIPIIILTADRPQYIRDTFDGQSINQTNIFNKHVTMSVELIDNDSKNNMWYNEKLMNESINKCIIKSLPIHINIPLSEPLYSITSTLKVNPKIIDVPFVKYYISKNEYKKEKKLWNKYNKKMILLGLNYKDKNLYNILKNLSKDPSIIIFSETISHICRFNFFSNIDQILFRMSDLRWNEIKPHILLTIGINVISKRIKYFLRKDPPLYHWHLGGNNINKYPDNYRCLNFYYYDIDISSFLLQIQNHNLQVKSDYRKNWNIINKKIKKKQKFFIRHKTKFSDLLALSIVFSKIPKYSILYLGNSMIIRYYQILKKELNIISYCNRGTSGIDGCISTAIGASIIIKKIITLVIGDISFFYDSNALWNNYTSNNFRIILINNGGGEIFNVILNSKKNISEYTTNFFNTKHNLTAEQICKMHHWKYFFVNKKIDLINILSFFWKKSKRPMLLEIDTKNIKNYEIFIKFLIYSSLKK